MEVIEGGVVGVLVVDEVVVEMEEVVVMVSQVRGSLVNTPVLYLLRDKCSNLFTLDQTVDVVFLATSDTTGYQSLYDESPSAYEDGELQGTIRTPPTHNGTDNSFIRK